MLDEPAANVSTRALEVFCSLASTGSLRDTARALGMSAPSASQQLRKLEATLGRALIDHEHRPLRPTPAGFTYLAHARDALAALRRGATAVSLNDLANLKRLRLGVIDDFDGEVSPQLVAALFGALASGELSLTTAPSHRILGQLASDALDFGVAARPETLPERLLEAPLLRDPFVVAVPRGHLPRAPDSFETLADLPFLRYSEQHFLGQRIAAELGWRRLSLPGRVVLDSNPVMFGLIAAGQGWTITTPLGFSRARRFLEQVDLHPLPSTGFARVISLYRAEGWHDDVPDLIAGSVRESLREHVIAPLTASRPWLAEMLTTLTECDSRHSADGATARARFEKSTSGSRFLERRARGD